MEEDDHKGPTKAGDKINSLQLLSVLYSDEDSQPSEKTDSVDEIQKPIVTPKQLFPIPLNFGSDYSHKRSRTSHSDQKPADLAADDEDDNTDDEDDNTDDEDDDTDDEDDDTDDEDDDTDDEIQEAISLSLGFPLSTSDSDPYHHEDACSVMDDGQTVHDDKNDVGKLQKSITNPKQSLPIPLDSGSDHRHKRARISRFDEKPANIKDTKKEAAEEDEDDDDYDEDDDDYDDINGELQKAILLSVSTSTSDQYCPEDLGGGSFDWKQKGVCPSFELKPLDYIERDDKYCVGEASMSTCVICTDEKPAGNLTRLSKNCCHLFCRDGCATDFILTSLKEDIDIYRHDCPVYKCKGWLDRDWCLPYIPPEVLRRRSAADYERWSLEVPKIILCPFGCPSRGFHDDKRGFTIRACPGCSKVFCMVCRAPFHMGLTCEEYEASIIVPSSSKKRKFNSQKRK